MNTPYEKRLPLIRQEFPHITEGFTYMNHCAISPCSNRVRSALDNYIEIRNRGPVEDFENWLDVASKCKEKICNLIQAESAEQIAFATNTSDGLSVVAEGIPWNAGDEILMNDMEFPANVHPFRALHRLGVKTTCVPSNNGRITADMIRDAISSKTRLVTVSAVQYLDGYRADLQEIGNLCRENNLLFVVDGIQSLGASGINVRESQIDALATGGHKWLMAPMGIGFLYLSNRLMSRLKPVKTGWRSVENPWDLTRFDQPWRTTADRFETGTPNMMGIIGLNASLQFLLDTGIDEISGHLNRLTRRAAEHIESFGDCVITTPMGEGERAGILSFRLPEGEDPEELIRKLREDRFVLSAREERIRIAPHFYNTEEEIDELFDRIRSQRKP